MVDILLLLEIILVLMVIALAISLLIVVPRDLQKKAVLALREKTWNSRGTLARPMVVAKMDKPGHPR